MTFHDNESIAEHLLVISGSATRLDSLLEDGFRLAILLPEPPVLAEVGELDVLGFHLAYGDLKEARLLCDELGEPWPFSEETPDSRAVRAYVAQHPELRVAAAKVMRNLQQAGHVSTSAWRREFWGSSSELRNVSVQRAQAEVAVIRFTDPVSRLPAMLNLALRNPELGWAGIVVDSGHNAQYWFDSTTPGDAGAGMKLAEQRFDDEDQLFDNSWLLHRPEGFSF